jgi:hypothetical protein
MSAVILLEIEDERVKKIRIPADSHEDQDAALSLMDSGLLRMIRFFNRSRDIADINQEECDE